jgi:putative tricarboxylic transport membrane protein
MTAASTGSSDGATEQGLVLHTEHLVTALLAAASLAVFVGTQNIRIPLTANVVDPRFVPRFVGALLALCAVLHGVTVARGNLGEPDEGEDVDLSAGTHWRAVFAVAASFIAHSQLISVAGWPLAAVVLFGGSALGLGAKKPLRVLLISIAVALTAFVLFRILLGVYLPAGPFEKWMP